jgi:hypothetical protein
VPFQISSNAGEIKAKKVKKRHKVIKMGVMNISEMLAHATRYLNTNINVYNEARTMETVGAGLNLTNLPGMVSKAQSVMGQCNPWHRPQVAIASLGFRTDTT